MIYLGGNVAGRTTAQYIIAAIHAGWDKVNVVIFSKQEILHLSRPMCVELLDHQPLRAQIVYHRHKIKRKKHFQISILNSEFIFWIKTNICLFLIITELRSTIRWHAMITLVPW